MMELPVLFFSYQYFFQLPVQVDCKIVLINVGSNKMENMQGTKCKKEWIVLSQKGK